MESHNAVCLSVSQLVSQPVIINKVVSKKTRKKFIFGRFIIFKRETKGFINIGKC